MSDPIVPMFLGVAMLIVWFFASWIIGFYVALKIYKLQWDWGSFLAASIFSGILGGLSESAVGLINRGAGRVAGGLVGTISKIELVSRYWDVSRITAIKIVVISGLITAGLIILGVLAIFLYFITIGIVFS